MLDDNGVDVFTLADIARMLELSRNFVSDRVTAGGVDPADVRGKRKLYKLRAVLPQLKDRVLPYRQVDPDELPPLARKHKLEGDLIERKLALDGRELLYVDEHVDSIAPLLQLYGQRLEMLPDILERKCALKPETVAAIQDAIDDWREDVAQAWTALADKRRADAD